MLSSMTPTIIIKDGKVRCVLGSPGGGRIINTVFQVTLNLLDHAMPLPDAVGAPRVHHQWKPDYLFYERGSLSGEVRAELLEMGHHFARGPRGIGRCQAIAVEADGSIIGASDPRSGGTAMAY
jgi:gamma-glutamyltranspeptidase/glutathione hydrolase